MPGPWTVSLYIAKCNIEHNDPFNIFFFTYIVTQSSIDAGDKRRGPPSLPSILQLVSPANTTFLLENLHFVLFFLFFFVIQFLLF